MSCGSPLAADQRYCLECGERRVPMSSVLMGGTPAPPGRATGADPAARSGGSAPTGGPPSDPAWQRNGTLTVIAGVGVLLLAMGVGVLIGKAGSSKQSSAPAQVISVSGGGGTGSAAGASSETFTSDWPAGTKGFTVQLQRLPAGTTTSAIEAAKTAASAKGAKAVGALKAEEFSSLSGGGYVVYAGVDHARSEAQSALAGLKGSFPSATVIVVSNGGSSSSSSSEGPAGSSSKGGVGSSITKPAPATVLESLKSAKGKSYEEKSKNLPDVVSTG